jgi:hypothetical protein
MGKACYSSLPTVENAVIADSSWEVDKRKKERWRGSGLGLWAVL